MKKSDELFAMCPYGKDLYAWVLSNIRKIEPFPVKGQLGLYEVNPLERREG